MGFRSIVTVILAMLFGVVVANASNILVWNYDYEDLWQGNTPDVAISTDLTALGHTTTTHEGTTLPSDISSYDMVYACIGWYRC